MALLGLLWHCSLESGGLAAGDPRLDDPAGGGAAGGPDAGAGASGTGGAPQQGGAGSPGGAAGGQGGGAPQQGAAGAGGTGQQGGGGGSPGVACVPAKGEFAVPSAPASCFFFLNEKAKVQPASGRQDWAWPEAAADCAQLGGLLASPASLGAWRELRDLFLAEGPVAQADVEVDDDLWLGARTALTQADDADELASSFVWEGGEPWVFVAAGREPWQPAQPDAFFGNVDEQCVEMDRGAEYFLNNLGCFEKRRLALCERPR